MSRTLRHQVKAKLRRNPLDELCAETTIFTLSEQGPSVISAAASMLAEQSNVAFAILFTAEAIAKLLAVGWEQYLRSGWNRFDLGVVIATDLGLLVGAGPMATAARVLRLGRIVRLLHRAPQLRVLFNAVVVTVPSLMNITSLLLLFYFIFATLGMQVRGMHLDGCLSVMWRACLSPALCRSFSLRRSLSLTLLTSISVCVHVLA